MNFTIHSNMISYRASQVFSSQVINLKPYLQDVFQYDIFNLMFIYLDFMLISCFALIRQETYVSWKSLLS